MFLVTGKAAKLSRGGKRVMLFTWLLSYEAKFEVCYSWRLRRVLFVNKRHSEDRREGERERPFNL